MKIKLKYVFYDINFEIIVKHKALFDQHTFNKK